MYHSTSGFAPSVCITLYFYASHYTFMWHFVEVDYLKQCSYIRLYLQLIPF